MPERASDVVQGRKEATGSAVIYGNELKAMSNEQEIVKQIPSSAGRG